MQITAFIGTSINIRICVILYCMAALTAIQSVAQSSARDPEPLRIGIVGLQHGHVVGFFRDALQREDVLLVGVVEEDRDLLNTYKDRYDLDDGLLFTDLERFLEERTPEAITVFSSTYAHKAIVETAAQYEIDVMMEKPMAVNMEHAEAIARAAEESGIHIMVNYETTWYPSNQDVYRRAVQQKELGTLRKFVVHDGHPGPKEIGVSEEFLDWLTDPVLNGGGALTDFGCYGANLMTWLLQGQSPVSVSAVVQQFKTDPVYAEVDDEATILVEYPESVGIIQASWNWPYDRKDMEVYGDSGYAFAGRRSGVQFFTRTSERGDGDLDAYDAEPVGRPTNDPLTYLRAVIREQYDPEPYALSSLENNLLVTRILDAARLSAQTGRRVAFDHKP